MTCRLFDLIKQGATVRQFQLVLESETNLECRNDRQETPLMAAMLNIHEPKKRLKTLLLLIEYNANVNCQNMRGQTPLMYTCILNMTTELKILLNEPRLQCNVQDFEGNTALMYACAMGKYEALETIVNAGCSGQIRLDPYLMNMDGTSAFDYARDGQDETMLKLLGRLISDKTVYNYDTQRNDEHVTTPKDIDCCTYIENEGRKYRRIDEYAGDVRLVTPAANALSDQTVGVWKCGKDGHPRTVAFDSESTKEMHHSNLKIPKQKSVMLDIHLPKTYDNSVDMDAVSGHGSSITNAYDNSVDMDAVSAHGSSITNAYDNSVDMDFVPAHGSSITKTYDNSVDMDFVPAHGSSITKTYDNSVDMDFVPAHGSSITKTYDNSVDMDFVPAHGSSITKTYDNSVNMDAVSGHGLCITKTHDNGVDMDAVSGHGSSITKTYGNGVDMDAVSGHDSSITKTYGNGVDMDAVSGHGSSITKKYDTSVDMDAVSVHGSSITKTYDNGVNMNAVSSDVLSITGIGPSSNNLNCVVDDQIPSTSGVSANGSSTLKTKQRKRKGKRLRRKKRVQSENSKAIDLGIGQSKPKDFGEEIAVCNKIYGTDLYPCSTWPDDCYGDVDQMIAKIKRKVTDYMKPTSSIEDWQENINKPKHTGKMDCLKLSASERAKILSRAIWSVYGTPLPPIPITMETVQRVMSGITNLQQYLGKAQYKPGRLLRLDPEMWCIVESIKYELNLSDLSVTQLQH